MKKAAYFLVFVLAVLVFAGCSGDDITAGPGGTTGHGETMAPNTTGAMAGPAMNPDSNH